VLTHHGFTAAFVAIVLSCANAVRAQSAPDPALTADIEKLLEITKANQIGVQMSSIVSQQVVDGLARQQPDVPPRMVEIVKQVLGEQFARAFGGPDGMQPKLVAVYAKHFTVQDVRGLIAFYSTDLGKKLIDQTPLLVQESAAVGQEWATQHMPEMMRTLEQRLRSEGFVK